ncbi:MAG: glycosyltransferase [Propionibacteriaceae bacterium]
MVEPIDGKGLRIAQMANFVSPTSGGMRQAIDALGRGYVAAGAQRILVVPGEKNQITEDESGVTVYVRAPKLKAGYRMIATPHEALRALEKFAPTSIEVSDKWTLTPAAGWAKRRQIGSVLFSHERLSDMLMDWLQRQFGVSEAVGALNRRLAKRYDAVVVTSDYAAAEFANTGANLVKVPLGVDLETFNPLQGSPSNLGVPQLCYVGRMSREKWPQLGVAAVAELHRRGVACQLTMYGTGPHIPMLQEIAGDAPVTFAGHLAGRDEVAKAFASSDISLSVCPTETFGLAVLEALASGTPVITANRGGARELVTQNCAQWGAPDPLHIADAIEKMLQRLADPVSAQQIRAAARARAQEYSWDSSVQQMLGLHRQLASKGKKS